MKSFKKLITIALSLSLLVVTSFGLTSTALAIDQQSATGDICAGIGTASGTGNNNCTNSGSGSSIDSTISSVINVLSYIIGATAVIMVIIGGLRYVISSGDSNAANSAKNTILYALVGMVVAALAQVLVHFVLSKTPSG